MADMRQEHYWVVGFPGDPNTVELDIKGQKFLAIPFSPILMRNLQPQILESWKYRVDIKTYNSPKGLKVEAFADSKYAFADRAIGDEYGAVRILAQKCRKPTETEWKLLEANLATISEQLKDGRLLGLDWEKPTHRLGEIINRDLPICTVRSYGSRARNKSVHLLAARR